MLHAFRYYVVTALAMTLLLPIMAAGAMTPNEQAVDSSPAGQALPNSRPNILWITAEDMSLTLGCYGDTFARSPHLDALARQSARYSHAFATTPVCSPARACLINGCIATTQGTHPMRSSMRLPADMTGFPSLLRQAGYYTTNNVKTDYNSAAESRIIQHSWDDSSEQAHWRNRSSNQPFFSVFNIMTSHQSRTMVWPYEQFQEEVQSRLTADEVSDPNKVPLPPYYPDTPLVRKTVARYYDCITAMDKEVGELLGQLDADGLADETIVFFYSDHGSGMPRHKRALFDSGMRVPLLIRFPEKFRHLAPTTPGEWTDRLVSFEDFAATVLGLAGIETLPPFMRGKAFLGHQSSKPPEYLFGHRDRVDEMIDMARSVRSRDYLYIRNFMPHLGYNQQSAWIDQGEVRRDFYALADSGNANAAQAQYLSPTRPVEELYDCVNDPLNLHNLADSPLHQHTFQAMRQALHDHAIGSRDLGVVPEIELQRLSEEMPLMHWSHSDRFEAQRLWAAAFLVGTQDVAPIETALADADASVRYWAVIACHSLDSIPRQLQTSLQRALNDSSPSVRIEAANVLARMGQTESAYRALEKLLPETNLTVLLHAARTIELLADPVHRDAMQALFDRFEDSPGDMAWFIRFTTTGYLSRLAN